MAEKQADGALEKLNQGIQKTKQMVQLQTIELAQEYFGESIETLKQQLKERRSTLEDLPRQVPWGQEESFQVLFQELMENYAIVEGSLDEAARNVANLDVEQLRKYAELEATPAARREARKRGVDLGEVEGTGSEGRIVVGDVRGAAKEAEHEATEEAEHEAAEEEEDEEELEAPDAANREAEEPSIRLEEIEGADSGGLIAGNGMTSSANGKRGDATGAKEEGAQPTWQASGDEDAGEPNATNAARYKAEELGIDLKEIEGTGYGRLITMSDVLRKA